MSIIARLRTAFRRRLRHADTLDDAPTPEETAQVVAEADASAASLPTGRAWKKRGLPSAEETEHAVLLRQQARDLGNAGARLQRRTDALLKRAQPGVYAGKLLSIETGRLKEYRVGDLLEIIERHGLDDELPPREQAEDLVRLVDAPSEEHAVTEPDWVTDIFSGYRPAALAA
ncbi:hypothetical protein [Streptomyces sp. NPDC050804]|uniref:hypothetical protein n=1 Tax=Streptomyces sp. NPDC050804 TaxID=3154745 RepID=UPI003413B1A1